MEGNRKPLGWDHLEDVARPDVFLHALRHLHILRLTHVGGRPQEQIALRSTGDFRAGFSCRLRQPLFQCLQPFESSTIIRPRITTDLHLHHRAHGFLRMIENDKLFHQSKTGIRHTQIILFGHPHSGLKKTDRLKSKKPYGSSGERGPLPRPSGHHPDSRQEFLHFVERIRMFRSFLLHFPV